MRLRDGNELTRRPGTGTATWEAEPSDEWGQKQEMWPEKRAGAKWHTALQIRAASLVCFLFLFDSKCNRTPLVGFNHRRILTMVTNQYDLIFSFKTHSRIGLSNSQARDWYQSIAC